MAFDFQPSDGLLNKVFFPSVPANETEARGQFMVLFNQVKDYLNSNLDATTLSGKKITDFATNNHTHTDYSKTNHNHDNDYIKSQDIDFSKTENGYFTFPGGLVINWGIAKNLVSNSSIKIFFSKPFPNNCFGIFTQGNYNESYNYTVKISSLDRKGCQLNKYSINSSVGKDNVLWFAIGF